MTTLLEALQTLSDNGLSGRLLDDILNDLIVEDQFDDDDDRRCVVALAWYREQGNDTEPSDCAVGYGDTVEIDGTEYRVLNDDEADAATKEYIEDSLWAFSASFLSGQTGIDQTVFEALTDKCEGANDAIRSIIDGSCGIDDFVEDAVRADGRGHMLSHYDGEEQEFAATRPSNDSEGRPETSDYHFLYRVN